MVFKLSSYAQALLTPTAPTIFTLTHIKLLQNKTKSLVSHNSKFRKYNFGGTGAAQRSSVISVVLSGKEEGCSAQAGWAGGEGAGGRYWAREGRRHTALEDAAQSDLNVQKTL